MAKKRSRPLKVLFIGNSFTQRNNLPGMLARMAALAPRTGRRAGAKAGAGMEWRLISVGGASLRRHWNKGEAARAIAEGHHDLVGPENRTGPENRGPKTGRR